MSCSKNKGKKTDKKRIKIKIQNIALFIYRLVEHFSYCRLLDPKSQCQPCD